MWGEMIWGDLILGWSERRSFQQFYALPNSQCEKFGDDLLYTGAFFPTENNEETKTIFENANFLNAQKT